MARLRPASSYRRLKRPYTRVSKFKKYSYVRGIPGCKVVMFDVGNKSREFPYSVLLTAKKQINLRHNAIEAARVTATKHIESVVGKDNFHLKVRAVPHHVIREHSMATGAGADRFSTGMARPWGKPSGLSARIRVGAPLIQIFVEKDGIDHAKEALRKAASKFPIGCSQEVIAA